jgi:hypothetical protein
MYCTFDVCTPVQMHRLQYLADTVSNEEFWHTDIGILL